MKCACVSADCVSLKVKAHTSKRPKRPELISMPRGSCFPHLDGMLVDHMVTLQQYVAGTHLYT